MTYVYIIKSLKVGRYYIGSCSNLVKRVNCHNAGQVRATCNFRPYELVFSKKFNAYNEARKIESKLKRLKRKDYIQKIIKSGEITLRATSSSGSDIRLRSVGVPTSTK